MDGASTTGKQTHNHPNPVKLSRAFGKITESSDPVLDICAAFKTRILRARDKIICDHRIVSPSYLTETRRGG